VLVAGTLVYGRGDEDEQKAELSAAVTDAMAEEQAAAPQETAPLLGGPSQAVPVGGGGGGRSVPIQVTGSLKATMNIGSYSRSFSRSVPRHPGMPTSGL